MELNKDNFKKYMDVFLTQNSMLNLISKNDEKFLWEKHIFDSLSIEKCFEKGYIKRKELSLLDIGTGGGFPSVPISIAYPEVQVYALDSIRKKINAIENIKAELDLDNLYTICDRAENIRKNFDVITSRAVAPLSVITAYAAPLMKNSGVFVAYKSRKAEEEIEEAKPVLKKNGLEIVDIIEYDLPLVENHTRNLIVIKKK